MSIENIYEILIRQRRTDGVISETYKYSDIKEMLWWATLCIRNSYSQCLTTKTHLSADGRQAYSTLDKNRKVGRKTADLFKNFE